jgi:hypothetical protein
LLHCEQFKKSAECAVQALSVDAANGCVCLIPGVALNKVGRCREALDELGRAVALPPHDAQIRYNPVALQESGQDECAMYECRACLEIDPDLAAVLWNLPSWQRTPAPAAYLIPHPEDRASAQEAASSGSRYGCRHIGMVWSANPVSTAGNRRARSVLSELLNEHLKDIDGVRFYTLMPAEHRAAVAAVPDLAITDLSSFVADFSGTAVARECMDVIVSVCTSSANLAGALGLKTCVLLQKHADWRWHNDTAWDPGVETHR